MKRGLLAGLALLFALAAAGCGRQAAPSPAKPGVPTDLAAAADMAAWAGAYPQQYETYLRTAEMEATLYGGSEPVDYLQKYPFLTTVYEGFGFSRMYRRSRGHYYALEDLKNTIRPKPGATCLTCKSSEYAYLIDTLGDGFWAADFDTVAAGVNHTVSCLDCHDPANMELRPVRGYVLEALDRLGAREEKPGNLVCAQCHVEYYFGPGKEVVLPWDNGLKIEDMERYFDERGFADWTHPRTGTPLVKIQHPEYELFKGSVHDNMGVTCAGCHMPKKPGQEGTFTSHWLTSPLKHMEESCASCHGDTAALRQRVENIQGQVYELKNSVGEKIAAGILALARAVDDGASESLLGQGRELHRRAQLYWDFIFVENSTGFHNGPEALRVLRMAEETADKLLEILAEYAN